MKSLHEKHGKKAGEVLQGAIAETANEQPAPSRFHFKQSGLHGNAITITDSQTGRSVEIGLFAYREARKILNGLFGDAPGDE